MNESNKIKKEILVSIKLSGKNVNQISDVGDKIHSRKLMASVHLLRVSECKACTDDSLKTTAY